MTMKHESLSERAKRWQSMMRSAANGVMLIAGEVTNVLGHWEDHADETDGLKAGQWCWRHLNRSKQYFSERAHAVEVLGRNAINLVDDSAAVWMTNSVPATHHKDLLLRVAGKQRKRGSSLPIDAEAVKRLYVEMIGAKPKVISVDKREAVIRAARDLVARKPDVDAALKKAVMALDEEVGLQN